MWAPGWAGEPASRTPEEFAAKATSFKPRVSLYLRELELPNAHVPTVFEESSNINERIWGLRFGGDARSKYFD